MGLFFDDPLFEEFSSWLALGLAPYGGGTLGEVRATCALVEDGNDDSWFGAWRDQGDRLVQAGDDSAASGHRVGARIVDARVWAGIHFRFADEQAAKIGRRVAHWGNRHAFR